MCGNDLSKWKCLRNKLNMCELQRTKQLETGWPHSTRNPLVWTHCARYDVQLLPLLILQWWCQPHWPIPLAFSTSNQNTLFFKFPNNPAALFAKWVHTQFKYGNIFEIRLQTVFWYSIHMLLLRSAAMWCYGLIDRNQHLWKMWCLNLCSRGTTFFNH